MKTRHFDSHRPGMLMFAQADAGARATPPPVIAAADSPTGAPIPSAPKAEPKAAEIVQPEPAVSKAPKKQSGIVDVKKALGLTEKPSKSLDREAQEIAKRAASKNVVPTPPIETAEERAAKKSEAAKILAQKEGEEENPEVALSTEEPEKPEVEPVKLKIGEKEMTAEEIAAYVAELEKKAAPPKEEKPVAEKPAAKVEKTPEEKAAETKKADEEFIARVSPNFATSEADLDILLSGGKPAVEMFARLRAQDQLATRKWLESTLNPILEDLRGSIDPVVQMHQEVEQYQSEGRFYQQFSDLKPNQKTVRAVTSALREKYPEQFAKMTEAERFSEIETNTRAIIKEFGGTAPAAAPAAAAAAPNAVKPAAPAKPKTPTPPAPTGNIGAGGAPKAVNEQAAQVAGLMAFEQRGRRA